MTEILVTCGAYEAIYSAISGLIETGDEVVIIEPFYDCYEPIVRIFGGTPRFVPLKYVCSYFLSRYSIFVCSCIIFGYRLLRKI